MPRFSILACVAAASGLLLAGAAAPAASPGAQSDAAALILLQQMRRAIGADALATLQAFSIDSSISYRSMSYREKGRMRKSRGRWACALPDRCSRITSITGFLIGMTHTWGFNRDQLVWFSGSTPSRNPERPRSTAHQGWAVKGLKHEFNRKVIPLLGAPVFDRYEASLAADETIGGRPVRVVAFRTDDRSVMSLRIDAATHLPVMLGWYVGDEDQRYYFDEFSWNVASGEHQYYFDDFRRTQGLLWPWHITEYLNGQLERETRIRKYEINRKVDQRRFQPVR